MQNNLTPNYFSMTGNMSERRLFLTSVLVHFPVSGPRILTSEMEARIVIIHTFWLGDDLCDEQS